MKAKLIIYWITTLLLSGLMAFNAYLYLTRAPKMVTGFTSLGYPLYFLTILGTAKLLGVLALLAPGLPRLKEWAYAGFAITFISAIWSHLASGQSDAVLMPIVCLIVLFISYSLRPFTRRISTVAVVV